MTDINKSHHSKFHDDPEFQSLLVRCLEALQRGEPIDGDSLAAKNPKYADEIRRFLDDRGMLEAMAAEFTGDDRTGNDSSPYEPTMVLQTSPGVLTARQSQRRRQAWSSPGTLPHRRIFVARHPWPPASSPR